MGKAVERVQEVEKNEDGNYLREAIKKVMIANHIKEEEIFYMEDLEAKIIIPNTYKIKDDKVYFAGERDRNWHVDTLSTVYLLCGTFKVIKADRRKGI